MAPDYNDGLWHGWNGGECPVHPRTVVEVALLDNGPVEAAADQWYWGGDKCRIIAFRVVEPYVPPLEVWIPVYAGGHLGGNYYSEEQAAQVASGHPVARVALFREVREAGDT